MGNGKFKHLMYDYYGLIAIILLFAGAILFGILYALGLGTPEVFLGIFGGVVAFFYFIHKQGLEEVRLFNELFRECNGRYDKLNEDLNRIRLGHEHLIFDETSILIDYFNLCGEEYLYYKRGYIFPEVWKAWCNGMLYFLNDARIKKVWQQEEGTGSYYGLTLDEIRKEDASSSR